MWGIDVESGPVEPVSSVSRFISLEALSSVCGGGGGGDLGSFWVAGANSLVFPLGSPWGVPEEDAEGSGVLLGLGVIIFLLSTVELVPAVTFAYDLSGGGIMGCFFRQSCVLCAAKHDKHEGGDPGHEATQFH